MTNNELRDTFASAALAGMLAREEPDGPSLHTASLVEYAYKVADAMLQERKKDEKYRAWVAQNAAYCKAANERAATNHDAAPAARASLPTADHAVRRGRESGCGTGVTPAIDRLREWERHGSGRWGIGAAGDVTMLERRLAMVEAIVHDAAPAARAETRVKEPTGTATGEPGGDLKARIGNGDISEAQIDALQCVVEDGRVVMRDYGHLRSLLITLRPEWENEPDRSQPVKDAESDRSKPINDDRLAALEELSALDQKLELEYGVTGNPMIKARQRTPPPHATHPQGSVQDRGSFRDSRNAIEPMAWLVLEADGAFWDIFYDEDAARTCAMQLDGTYVPLYRDPPPPTLTDAERWAMERAAVWMMTLAQERREIQSAVYLADDAATLRGLLARLGGTDDQA